MDNIRLTVPVLAAQSIELNTLKNSYDELFQQATNCLRETDDCLSTAISNNFSNKIVSAQKSFQKVSSTLTIGANAARVCALTFGQTSISDALQRLEDNSNITGSFPGLTASIIEGLKDSSSPNDTSVSGVGGPIKDAFENTEQIIDSLSKRDYKGAIEQIASGFGINLKDNELYSWGSDAQDTIKSLGDMASDFKKNIMEGSLGSTAGYLEALQNGDYVEAGRKGLELGFHLSGGTSAVDVAGKNALNIVKLIPGYRDYYKDVNDTAGAFEKVMGDMYQACTGNSDGAAYIGNYYTSRGGLAGGLADGAMTIGNAVGDSVSEHGGIISSIIDGWKSILG